MMENTSNSLNSSQIYNENSTGDSKRTTSLEHTFSEGLSLKEKYLELQEEFITLKSEYQAVEEKNKDLLESLQSEKLIHAATRKEAFHYNRAYHEAMIKINSYEVKLAEMGKVLRSGLKEIDSSYPHLIQVTNVLTHNKTMFQAILSSLPPSGTENLPYTQNAAMINDDFNKKNDKPMKQRVGPMVRGLLITKPKIMLERIMLPPQQEQETIDNNNGMSIEETNNPLTPIQEENEPDENECLRHISMRPKKKSVLGSSWKAKRQEKIEKSRQRENPKPLPAMDYDNDSSDSESNPNHVEPVVRFRDVSRLLQNSSLMKVDLPRSVDVSGGGSKFNRQVENESCNRMRNVSRNTEDPLEGSSWMFNNVNRHNFIPSICADRRSSLLKATEEDDNDYDEDDEIVPQRRSNSSVMNSVLDKNKTFAFPSPQRISNSYHEVNDDEGSPVAEPDSTNNFEARISDFAAENSNISMSFGSIQKLSYGSRSTSLTRNFQSNKKVTNCCVLLAEGLSNSSNTADGSSSKNCSRSSVSNAMTEQNQVDGKRVRKPKKHFYPGEEDCPPSIKKQKGKKSLPKNIARKKSSTNKIRKTSLITPRSSTDDTSNCGNESSGISRPSRKRKIMSYKESPLNAKQRRP